MMYLSNKQMLQLAMPILLAVVLLYFQDEILTFMHEKLPQHTMNKDHRINEKANIYLRLNRDMNIYNDIEKNVKERKISSVWISKNFIYKKKKLQSDTKIQKKTKKYIWKLEAVFPKHDMAIINTQFVHTNSVINKAKVIKIKFDSVLLKTSKGLQWVYLFH